MSAKHTLKRDGQHETPQGASQNVPKSVPSERALRLQNRTLRLKVGVQAADEKSSYCTLETDKAWSESSSLRTRVMARLDRKTSLVSQPEQHHRVGMKANAQCQPSPSSDGDLSATELFQHKSRKLTSLQERNKKEKINLPPPTSNAWKGLNAELENLIPNQFSNRFRNLSVTRVSQKFDDWIYNYLVEKFGTTPLPVNPNNAREQRTGIPPEKRKKEVQRIHKTLVKADLYDTVEDKNLHKNGLVLYDDTTS